MNRLDRKEVEEYRPAVYERAVEILCDDGYEASVYEEYSGRFMYGDTTTAIQTGAAAAVVGWAVTRAAYEMFVEKDNDQREEHERTDYDHDMFLREAKAFIPTHWDTMGCDEMVYYWRH